jgi:hypothetical protein
MEIYLLLSSKEKGIAVFKSIKGDDASKLKDKSGLQERRWEKKLVFCIR